ncbi:MAG: alkaline phosphatase D family protein, partial [Verrucomicrobiota bacterium]
MKDITIGWKSVLLLLLASTAWGQTRLETGPLLGHVSPHEARIWVATTGAAEVGIKFGLRADLSDGAVQSVPGFGAERHHMGQVRITGLQPDTTYYYAVLLDGLPIDDQPIRSFRTAPPEGTDGRLRLVFGSCFGDLEGRFKPENWAMVADQVKPDLILQMGDNHYAETTDPERQRRFYNIQRSMNVYRRATSVRPTYAIWDDHDFAGNDTDGTAEGKERSLKTFKEHWANPSYGEVGNPGIYSTFVRGNIQFFLLDGRYHRDPNRARNTPDKTLLGAEQTEWLKRELKKSTAKIKLICSGSEFQLNGRIDSWSSFKYQQKAFLDFLKSERLEGVILLSGDRHFTAGYQIRGQVVEITSGPFGGGTRVKALVPDMFMSYAEDNFFCLLDIDTRETPPTVGLEVYQADKGLIHQRAFTWDELHGRTRIKPILPDAFDTTWPSYTGTGSFTISGEKLRLMTAPDNVKLLWNGPEHLGVAEAGTNSPLLKQHREAAEQGDVPYESLFYGGASSPIAADRKIYVAFYQPSGPTALLIYALTLSCASPSRAISSTGHSVVVLAFGPCGRGGPRPAQAVMD